MNLKERIETLEQILSEMKEEYETEKERQYRASPHKSFKVGDWIYKDKEFGKVAWTENKACNLPEEDGYVGIDIYSGTRGFRVCQRDDWSLMSKEDRDYLTKSHTISLSGEEIQVLRYVCRTNCTDTEEILRKLMSAGKFSKN